MSRDMIYDDQVIVVLTTFPHSEVEVLFLSAIISHVVQYRYVSSLSGYSGWLTRGRHSFSSQSHAAVFIEAVQRSLKWVTTLLN